jgi:hypothetical protein
MSTLIYITILPVWHGHPHTMTRQPRKCSLDRHIFWTEIVGFDTATYHIPASVR